MNINIIVKETPFINPKAFDLISIFFKKNYNLHYFNDLNTIEYLNKNNNDKTTIILYFDNVISDSELNILNFIKNNQIFCKIFFIIIDFWKIPDIGREKQHKFISDIFQAKNYKVICSAKDVQQLCDINNQDFSQYANNLIFCNIWSCYNSSFCDFNNSPIESILISGHTNSCYPERYKMTLAKNTIYYHYNGNDINNINNNYNLVLNKYLCCFYSSVFLFNHAKNEMTSINVVLLKAFEILASGSLLLAPKTEEISLKTIGLIDKENYLTIDFENDLNQQIDFIFNKDNKDLINKIRYNGYIHAKENLTTEKKFLQFNNLFQQ
jgi:hypothetical protein